MFFIVVGNIIGTVLWCLTYEIMYISVTYDMRISDSDNVMVMNRTTQNYAEI